MRAISSEKFLVNLKNLSQNFNKIFKQEIIDLFEPVVFQVVLYTRVDTGRARKEFGEKFAQKVGSQRIKDAIDYDVEVNHALYNHWSTSARADSNNSIFSMLANKGKISVKIQSSEEGLVSQEQGALPSQSEWMETNRPQNTPDRMPPRHVTIVADGLNAVWDLTKTKPKNMADYIVKDIEKAVNKIIDKITVELMK
jgi:hypothetical protein